MEIDPVIDYEAAANFLQQALIAERDGDEKLALAARQMVAVALGVSYTDTAMANERAKIKAFEEKAK